MLENLCDQTRTLDLQICNKDWAILVSQYMFYPRLAAHFNCPKVVQIWYSQARMYGSANPS